MLSLSSSFSSSPASSPFLATSPQLLRARTNMASSSLDLDLARLSLGGSPFGQHGSSNDRAALPHNSQSPYPPSTSQLQQQQQQQQLLQQQQMGAGVLQPHQIMQPPIHSGPPPHVQLQEPQRRRGVVKFFSGSLNSLVSVSGSSRVG